METESNPWLGEAGFQDSYWELRAGEENMSNDNVDFATHHLAQTATWGSGADEENMSNDFLDFANPVFPHQAAQTATWGLGANEENMIADNFDFASQAITNTPAHIADSNNQYDHIADNQDAYTADSNNLYSHMADSNNHYSHIADSNNQDPRNTDLNDQDAQSADSNNQYAQFADPNDHAAQNMDQTQSNTVGKKRGWRAKEDPAVQKKARDALQHWGNKQKKMRSEWDDKKIAAKHPTFDDQVNRCARRGTRGQKECLLRTLQICANDEVIASTSGFSDDDTRSFFGWTGFKVLSMSEFQRRIDEILQQEGSAKIRRALFSKVKLFPTNSCWDEAWAGQVCFQYKDEPKASPTPTASPEKTLRVEV